jgi:hypothetical protein
MQVAPRAMVSSYSYVGKLVFDLLLSDSKTCCTESVLCSASYVTSTIKLRGCESRQLLAPFDVRMSNTLTPSPDSRQLAYTTIDDQKGRICICNISPDVLAQASVRIPCKIHCQCSNIPLQTSACKNRLSVVY